MPRAKTKHKAIRPPAQTNTRPSNRRSPASESLRGKELERAVERFQSEPDDSKAHKEWKKIESAVFGVQFDD
jgi:hypothetical protein